MNAQTQITPASRTFSDTVASEDLFHGASVLTIKHQGMDYTLRITRQGKLLLTK